MFWGAAHHLLFSLMPDYDSEVIVLECPLLDWASCLLYRRHFSPSAYYCCCLGIVLTCCFRSFNSSRYDRGLPRTPSICHSSRPNLGSNLVAPHARRRRFSLKMGCHIWFQKPIKALYALYISAGTSRLERLLTPTSNMLDSAASHQRQWYSNSKCHPCSRDKAKWEIQTLFSSFLVFSFSPLVERIRDFICHPGWLPRSGASGVD